MSSRVEAEDLTALDVSCRTDEPVDLDYLDVFGKLYARFHQDRLDCPYCDGVEPATSFPALVGRGTIIPELTGAI